MRGSSQASVRTEGHLATEAYYATVPAELAKLSMLAGSPACHRVLDPFVGCCTTGEVAEHLGPYGSESSSPPEYASLVW
jgi:hypothetical protein